MQFVSTFDILLTSNLSVMEVSNVLHYVGVNKEQLLIVSKWLVRHLVPLSDRFSEATSIRILRYLKGSLVLRFALHIKMFSIMRLWNFWAHLIGAMRYVTYFNALTLCCHYASIFQCFVLLLFKTMYKLCVLDKMLFYIYIYIYILYNIPRLCNQMECYNCLIVMKLTNVSIYGTPGNW